MMKAHRLFRLCSQYDQLSDLLEGVNADFLIKRHIPDKWSIHENIAHLVRYQEIFAERNERLLSEHQPAFLRYTAEKDPEFEKWCKVDTAQLVATGRAFRKTLFMQISNLPEAALRRAASHPKFGLMDMERWTEFFLLHESHHFFTIFRLKQEFS